LWCTRLRQQREELTTETTESCNNYDKLPDWKTTRMNGVCTTDQFMFVRIPKLHSPTNNYASFTTNMKGNTVQCAPSHLIM